uniref:Uncharacterized protein n=1 Tax=mine drainage metagenome TaxID=410659 RepID=E6Q0Q5_9ZZZZ
MIAGGNTYVLEALMAIRGSRLFNFGIRLRKDSDFGRFPTTRLSSCAFGYRVGSTTPGEAGLCFSFLGPLRSVQNGSLALREGSI